MNVRVGKNYDATCAPWYSGKQKPRLIRVSGSVGVIHEIDSHYFVDEALKITGVLDALGEVGRTDRYETMVKLSMIDLEEEYSNAFNNANELYEAMQSIVEERLAEIPLMVSYLN